MKLLSVGIGPTSNCNNITKYESLYVNYFINLKHGEAQGTQTVSAVAKTIRSSDILIERVVPLSLSSFNFTI